MLEPNNEGSILVKTTKSRLKRIIRKEYARLKRQGLIREYSGDEHHEHPHADVPSRSGGGYDSPAANKLADELMEAFLLDVAKTHSKSKQNNC